MWAIVFCNDVHVHKASGCWKQILLGSILTKPSSTIKSIDTSKKLMIVFTSEWQNADTEISPSKVLDEKTALRGKTKAPAALIFCRASASNESIHLTPLPIHIDSKLFCSRNTIFSICSGWNCLVGSQKILLCTTNI